MLDMLADDNTILKIVPTFSISSFDKISPEKMLKSSCLYTF